MKNIIFRDDAILRRLSGADNAFAKTKCQITCITMDDTKHTMVRSMFEKLVMEYVRGGLGAMCSLAAGSKLWDTYDMYCLGNMFHRDAVCVQLQREPMQTATECDRTNIHAKN